MQLADLDVSGVFPTPVGMNRRLKKQMAILKSVPHTRGDEPMMANHSKSA